MAEFYCGRACLTTKKQGYITLAFVIVEKLFCSTTLAQRRLQTSWRWQRGSIRYTLVFYTGSLLSSTQITVGRNRSLYIYPVDANVEVRLKVLWCCISFITVTGFSFGNVTQIELPSHGKSFLTSIFLKYCRCISCAHVLFSLGGKKNRNYMVLVAWKNI